MRASSAVVLLLSGWCASSLAADQAFFDEAARSGLAEVALGQLAVTQGSTESVKRFGGLMVDEHGAAKVKLEAAAAKSGAQLPVDLPSDVETTRKKLELLNGKAFDLAYVESQSKAHAATVKLLEKEIASGTDPAAKEWAKEVLPMVKRHAELVGSLDAMPGEHNLEHAVGTPGPADTPPGPAKQR